MQIADSLDRDAVLESIAQPARSGAKIRMDSRSEPGMTMGSGAIGGRRKRLFRAAANLGVFSLVGSRRRRGLVLVWHLSVLQLSHED